MDGNPTTRTGARVTIGDTVTFVHQSHTWIGIVVKTHRASAHVVCDHQRGFRVPYALLTVSSDPVRPPVQRPTDHRRASFHTGDRVQFVVRGTTVVGLVARLNPQRAHVITERAGVSRLVHSVRGWKRTLLQPRREPPKRSTPSPTVHANFWSIISCRCGVFTSTTVGNVLGVVVWDTGDFAVVRICEVCPEEEILDRFSEIAHALVGKAHHHDDMWRAKAVAIGCSGRRCHDLQFTLPRYIVQCERGCWVTTAERRRRHVLCRRCRGALVYQTYTEERWQRTQAGTREGTESPVVMTKTHARK